MKITPPSASTAKHTPGVCFGYAHRVCVGLVVWGLMAGAVLGGTSPAWAKEKVEDGWYPFSFSEKLDPNSPANIGKLVLDAPAGKHGFVKVKDGHFQFSDGTPIKFWGTNIVSSANFPDKKQAEMLADRIAFFGFNAVRLHHMDSAFEPRGIFEDIAPMYKDPQMKETGTLSKRQLDRLDYLIYLLKQRGIYVDMNLLVSRRFTEADGVVYAAKLGPAAKPVSMFDPKLIELQKQYAKDLLTHFNPYTKLRYADDAVVALIEITNENSILGSWEHGTLDNSLDNDHSSFPAFYTEQLDRKWNEWLKKKYKTVLNLKTAWDSSNTPNSTPSIINAKTDTSLWKIEQTQGAIATTKSTPYGIQITVQETTSSPWHIQYVRPDLYLKKENHYLIKFRASSEKNCHIELITQGVTPPYKFLGLSQKISLINQEKEFEIITSPAEDCARAKIGFLLGQSPNVITIQNISIEEFPAHSELKEEYPSELSFKRPAFKLCPVLPPQQLNDIILFYKDLQADYISTMTNYLRREIGIKIPITCIGGMLTEDDKDTQTACDFIDTHAYWDHPQFPRKPWDAEDFIMHNKSPLQQVNLGIIGEILKYATPSTPKPFTVSEWQHAFPSPYAYETPMLLAYNAVKGRWAGLFQFASLHHNNLLNHLNLINKGSFFDTQPNPQQLILTAMGSYFFQKSLKTTGSTENGVLEINAPNIWAASGKINGRSFNVGEFTIQPKANGTLVIFRNDSEHILISIGEIKNTDGRWNNDKRYLWGQAPTLLQSIPLDIRRLDNQPIKEIYALDERGETNIRTSSTSTIADHPWYLIR